MPTEPLDYRILLALKAALQAIAVSAGYFYSLDDAAVKLDAEHGVEELIKPNGPRPFALVEIREDARQYWPANQTEYELRYTVHWVHEPAPVVDGQVGEPSPTADTDRTRMFCRGVADVEKALAAMSGGTFYGSPVVEAVRWNPVNGGQEVWAEIDVAIRVMRDYGAQS